MNIDLLIQLLADISKIPAEEISADTNLYLDLGMDSLEFFKLVTSLEEELGAELKFLTMETVSTVAELQSVLSSRNSFTESREIYHG